MTTKQTGLDFLGRTPEGLIAAGRADSIQSAKRLLEIARLEAINDELLEACKEMLQYIGDCNGGMDTTVNGWIADWHKVIAKTKGKQ